MIRKPKQSERTELMGEALFSWMVMKVSLKRGLLQNKILEGVSEGTLCLPEGTQPVMSKRQQGAGSWGTSLVTVGSLCFILGVMRSYWRDLSRELS